MSRKLLRLSSKLLAITGLIFGFASTVAAQYGVPAAMYMVKKSNPEIVQFRTQSNTSNNYKDDQALTTDNHTIKFSSIRVTSKANAENHIPVFETYVNQEKDAILISNLVSISENKANQLNIYPNPNKRIFLVEFKNNDLTSIKLRLVSSLGLTVLEEEILNFSGRLRKQINLEKYATGLYLVQIITEDKIISRQLIKQ